MTVFNTTRRTLLTLIGGLSIFREARGRGADTFTLVPQLAPGQVHRYRQDTHLRRNGAVGHRSRSIVTLEIGERVAQGWRASWTSSRGELLDADPQMRPLLEALMSLWEGIAIELLLDDSGRVLGLADPEAVRMRGKASLDRLVALLQADPSRAPITGPLQAVMQQMTIESGMLARTLLKEPSILLGAMGNDYRVGVPLEVRTRVASPMGSGEIPVLGRYQVRGISSRDARADIGWLMVLDAASLARTLAAEIQGLARAPVADSLTGLDFDDRGDFIIDTASAWPASVRHERRVSIGEASRIDTVKLTRLEG